MFGFITSAFKKFYGQVQTRLHSLFSRTIIDEEAFTELESILLQADVGFKTTRFILEKMRATLSVGTHDGVTLKVALEAELQHILSAVSMPEQGSVYVLVGINGSGKTTSAAKLAHQFKQAGKKVLLVAADTFRAAAVDQLKEWANRIGVEIVIGKENQDPASVVFAGVAAFKQGGYDVLIIDTAGRLQTKANLMKELEKIKKVVVGQIPDHAIMTLLTVDAMLGQNSFDQARIFHESTHLNGIILTKTDGTGKGGIVFAIAHELKLPVVYVSSGEKLEDITLFDSKIFVSSLF